MRAANGNAATREGRRDGVASSARRVAAALVLLAPLCGAPPSPAAAADGGATRRPLAAKLERLDGTKLRLSERRGQPLLLDLWATWCRPCREQAAVLRDASSELSSRGVAVLAINEGERVKLVREFLAQHPPHFEIALDRDQVVLVRLEVVELPALVLLDAEGKVVGLRKGVTRRDGLLELLSAVRTDAGG
jgi:thiol-disulfide isomerase/thioredoxin